jgi:hypothetical protein
MFPQVRAREGLEKVRLFARENPSFGASNEAEVAQKVRSVELMQALYEASLFKVQTALGDLWDTGKPHYKYSNLISTTYDKQVILSS